MPWIWLLARLGALTAERVSFNRLGKGTSPLVTATVAYGGAALGLMLVALMVHRQAAYNPSAVYVAVIYTGSFFLYVWALSLGPLSVVAPWPIVTTLLLWLWHPEGGGWGMAGIIAIVAGGFLLAGGKTRVGAWRAIGLMLVSDVLLAWARILDQGRPAGPLFPYAATLFLVVGLLFVVAAVLTRQTDAIVRTLRERPVWSVVAAGANGTAYLTLIGLLQYWPPYLIEAMSGGAGILSVLVGVLWLGEAGIWPKTLGAIFMAGGGALLLTMHGSVISVQ